MPVGMNTPFELRTLPDERGRARLFLIQLPRSVVRLPAVDEPRTVGRMSDGVLQGVYEVLDDIVRPYLTDSMTITAGVGPLPPATVTPAAGRSIDSAPEAVNTPGQGLVAWRTERTIPLAELPGVRVLLLCHATATLRSTEKITHVARTLMSMDEEDVMYWSRKVSDTDGGRKRFTQFITGAF